jgi:hypothetical protein
MNIRLLLSMSKQISFPRWCCERCNYFPFHMSETITGTGRFPLPPTPSPWAQWFAEICFNVQAWWPGARAPLSAAINKNHMLRSEKSWEWQVIRALQSVESEGYSQAPCSPSQRMKFSCVSSETRRVCNTYKAKGLPEEQVWQGGVFQCHICPLLSGTRLTWCCPWR